MELEEVEGIGAAADEFDAGNHQKKLLSHKCCKRFRDGGYRSLKWTSILLRRCSIVLDCADSRFICWFREMKSREV